MSNQSSQFAIQPILSTNDIERLSSFYAKLFGAEEQLRAGRCSARPRTCLGATESRTSPTRTATRSTSPSSYELMTTLTEPGPVVICRSSRRVWAVDLVHVTGERIAMDRTEQGELRVLGGVRIGGLPRAAIDGSLAWP
jgi:hypothetical protein